MGMKLGRALGKPENSRTYREASELPLPSCCMGVEVEVENFTKSDPEVGKYWTQKRDDSLRGRGAEFVFTEPLFGRDMISAIRLICEQGIKHKWETNYRTSIHVHLDARDLTFEAFKALCCTYAIVEPVLYSWVGDKRNESVFCLPWQDAEGDIDRIRKLFVARNDNSLARDVEWINRYSGLNLKSLARFGSIEFRHMRTTFDFERVMTWVRIIQTLKAYSTTLSESTDSGFEFLEIFSKVGPEGFIERVFGTDLSKELLRTLTNYDLYPGILLAQDLLRNDLLTEMGMLFAPTNAFLTPCKANKYIEKFISLNPKPKSGTKVLYSEIPDGFVGHSFVPAINVTDERRCGKFLAWDEDSDSPFVYNRSPVSYELYCPPETAYTMSTVHGALSNAWRQLVNQDILPEETKVGIYDRQDTSPWTNPWE